MKIENWKWKIENWKLKIEKWEIENGKLEIEMETASEKLYDQAVARIRDAFWKYWNNWKVENWKIETIENWIGIYWNWKLKSWTLKID